MFVVILDKLEVAAGIEGFDVVVHHKVTVQVLWYIFVSLIIV